MAEQTLSEIVMNLINWIESLHEKNLKYEAQVESLSRDLARVQDSNEQLEARLTAYQNGDHRLQTIVDPTANMNGQMASTVHPQHQQTIYSSMVNHHAVYATQPAVCTQYHSWPYAEQCHAVGHQNSYIPQDIQPRK